ncbi:uncharacterized protein BO88DRAFT_430480 [Aspergillus vadensis CBS 113365]|uniref:Uncharacterized protein n=1 Tax=Aspergillus vadensis (strain CBS 113365 / IMI 142717 / IBT 24658) TaxID=1448311 RepID=A0A319AUU1_ASPVC|nr:hypothetical protein BO88DRAFT_430480 [Aspergillus vadensis CBS 113365]PYH63455.1 hypothetical protein BO88DRAFT_430480 [Aspergillus vadensis CBS 113365]
MYRLTLFPLYINHILTFPGRRGESAYDRKDSGPASPTLPGRKSSEQDRNFKKEKGLDSTPLAKLVGQLTFPVGPGLTAIRGMFDAGGRPPSLAALTIPGKCPPFSCHSRPVTPFVANRVQSLFFYNSLPPHFLLPERTTTNPKISLHITVFVGWMQYGLLQTRPSHVQLQKSGDEHPTSRNGKGWTGPVTLIGHDLRGCGLSGTNWGLVWVWAVRVAGETLGRIKWI